MNKPATVKAIWAGICIVALLMIAMPDHRSGGRPVLVVVVFVIVGSSSARSR